MNEQGFRPIAATLMRRALLWAALCMLGFGCLQGWLTYRAVQHRFENSLQEIGTALAPTLAELTWTLEQRICEQQLESVLQYPSVGHATLYAVTNESGVDQVFAQAGNPAFKRKPSTQVFDIRRDVHRVGSLELSLNTDALYSEVLKSVAWVLAECAVLTLLLVATILRLLKRDLQQPMQALAAYVNSLQAKELTTPLALGRRASKHADEIDLVADALHTLQGKLGQHIETLDSKVAERTAQLQNALDTLKALSTLDPLTGCHNRMLFEQRLQEELSRAQRYGRPLSAIFCDVDRFKSVNDTHGHGTGDAVLAAVGRCLRDSLRTQIDWVTRYGGEEFVIVLPETSLGQAIETAERMRQCVVQQVCVPLEGGGSLRVTLSFGVAQQQAMESGAALLKRADQWLFAAKHGGRNQVQPGFTQAEASSA